MVYFVRHAHCEANSNLIWRGSTESPLSSIGKQQLKHLAHFFAGRDVDIIYSSPLSRASDTALAIQKAQFERLNKPKIKLIESLSEFDGGDWEGLSSSELHKRKDYSLFCSNIDQAYAENGETIEQLKERAKEIIGLLKNQNKNIVVVSHGVFLRALNSILQNTSIDSQPWIDNCGCTMYNSSLDIVRQPFCSFIPDELKGFNQNTWLNPEN